MMSVKEDLNEALNEGLDERVQNRENTPGVEVWPEEDDFGRWVASRRDRVRTVICETAEFKDAPFCGRGHH